jgi:alkylhydroperoxidase family enzyme
MPMAARLPYIDREGLPEGDRGIYDKLVQERGAGPVGNIFRTLANAPNLLRRFNALGGELRNKTQLDPKLRELALMTVGRLTNAEYEFTITGTSRCAWASPARNSSTWPGSRTHRSSMLKSAP